MAFANKNYPICFVVDELAGVTSPSKAGEFWHAVVSRGRKYGVSVFAGSQRPQEIDKTLLGNRSMFWCGSLEREKDREYVSRETDISMEVLRGLRGNPFFDHVSQKRGCTHIIYKSKKKVK